ncbi:MAG: hypothetical protein Q7R77_02110 [Candidatus Daviesbacteria bacterium]|nr:hypothetical protein [Candidatus Daviesbacteria bacterium]
MIKRKSEVGSRKTFLGQSGQILIIVFITLGVVLFTVLFIISGAQIYYQNASYSVNSEKAIVLAEAGVDKALSSLNKTGGSYNGELETALGDGTYSVTIISTDASTKVIEATGYVPNKVNARAKRTIKITSSRGVGVAFNYGIQVGEGGMELGNSNLIKGSIYSNGSIIAGNNNIITGDAYVAGGAQASADQQTDCNESNCTDYIFGKSVSGENRLDVAQSFKPVVSEVLNQVSIKIKKVSIQDGFPLTAEVRILGDSGGKPNKNAVLASGGFLYSNQVSANYPPSGGWIDIAFSTSPVLIKDTTYWLMISTTSNSSNYWVWQNDIAQNYTRGQPKWSSKWNAGNPTWTAINGDLSFETYMGGAPTAIKGGSEKMNVNGEVYANTIENLVIGKDTYYQTIANSTVGGGSCPNAKCHPGSADPSPKVFPISDANVEDWKRQAGNCDSSLNNCQNVLSGDITSCVSTFGSVKIEGNVNLNSGCSTTIKTPIWITGNLTLNSNNILTLDSSYGETSGVIIVSGKVELNSNNHLNGTGVGSSLLMVLTTYDSKTNDQDAIQVNSNGNTGTYYASTGIINPGTGNSFKELTAWKIKLINSSTIDYETGLSSLLFTSGPSGIYSLVKGTYQVK